MKIKILSMCICALGGFYFNVLMQHAHRRDAFTVHIQEEVISVQEPTYNFDKWLSEFKANDPQYQDFCMDAFRNDKAASQFSQDIWLFNNVFKEFTVAGKKGFYVDSGANDYRYISNTFFFDVCLGWEGLCVEPVSSYHNDI